MAQVTCPHSTPFGVRKSSASVQRIGKPANKVRTCRLATTHTGSVALTIRQQEGKQAPQTDVYDLEPIPSQLGGRGLILHKHDCKSYCVNLSGLDSTCDCQGFERWGWHLDENGELTACKHINSLLALQKLGRL
jgi:hypothetical protein